MSLRHISDRAFHANHPINLDSAFVARVLSGVLVKERQRGLQAMLSASDPIHVFSAEEIQFLAPLVAKALATAAPDEVVEFLLTSQRYNASALEFAATETTGASLYAYGETLGFLLSQYRYLPARTDTENMAHRRLPDTSGLADRVLLFSPSSAQRSDHLPRPSTGRPNEQFLVIDYPVLLQSSPSAATTAQGPAPVTSPNRQDDPSSGIPPDVMKLLEQRDEDIRGLKDLVIKKDLELETIRTELQSLRKQLDAQPRQDNQKQKTKPPSKPRQTTP